MLVRDVMTAGPVTTTPQTSTKAALRQLAERRITALPVVDCQGRLCGIVSEADLIQDLVVRDPRAQERPIMIDPLYPPTTVEEVYTRAAVTVAAEDDVSVAVQLMTETGAKSLPVLDDDRKPVGVLSRSDVIRALARDDAAIAADIDRVLASIGHADWLVEVVDGRVRVTGPVAAGEAAIAKVVAQTVPGVVHVDVAAG
jgi:CBS-domain-containing membrane protein